MRVLGVDLGSKRIGIAVSDRSGTIASALTVIQRSGSVARDHQAIAKLVVEEEAEAVVVDTMQKIEAANEKVNESPFPLAVNNVLAGISDKHLEALYLLKQRSA